MIDDKDLAEDEREQKMLVDHYANYPDMVGMFKKRIEIIRNARRYLALRSEGVVIASGDWYRGPQVLTDEQIDAAADRLLEGGE